MSDGPIRNTSAFVLGLFSAILFYTVSMLGFICILYYVLSEFTDLIWSFDNAVYFGAHPISTMINLGVHLNGFTFGVYAFVMLLPVVIIGAVSFEVTKWTSNNIRKDYDVVYILYSLVAILVFSDITTDYVFSLDTISALVWDVAFVVGFDAARKDQVAVPASGSSRNGGDLS